MKKTKIAVVFLATLLTAVMAVSLFAPVQGKAEDGKIISSIYIEPDGDSMLVGLPGSYCAGQQDALDRLNEIRKEACTKGYPDPRDPSRKLKKSDYVPMKWSAPLEEYARLRACEASLFTSHGRPGDNIENYDPSHVRGSAEVLAWPGGTLAGGVELWYTEKDIWVKQGKGETGHYTSMIDPDNTYVGLGGFALENGFGSQWGACVCGRFESLDRIMDDDSIPSLQDETMAPAMEHIIQAISVDKSALGKPEIMQISSGFSYASNKAYLGETVDYGVVRTATFDNDSGGLVLDLGGYTFESSKPELLGSESADGFGFVAKKTGKTRITATNGTTKLSKKIKVTTYMKAPKISSLRGGTKRLKVKLKAPRNSAIVATRFEVQIARNKAFTKGVKTAKIKVKEPEGPQTKTVYSKTIKKLKAKKNYYVRVRAVTEFNVAGRDIYTCSRWSKAKKVKTKK